MSRQRRAAPSISAAAPTAPRRIRRARRGAAEPGAPSASSARDGHAIEGEVGQPRSRVHVHHGRPAEARGGRIDEEQRHAFGRPRRHQQHAGDVAPRDVALDAGELPAGRRLLGARRDRVRAPVEIGVEQGHGRARLTGGDGRQPALLLHVGAGLGDGVGDQHRRPVGPGIGGAPELLEQQRGLDHAEAAAAVLFRQRQTQPAELGHLFPHGLRSRRADRPTAGAPRPICSARRETRGPNSSAASGRA